MHSARTFVIGCKHHVLYTQMLDSGVGQDHTSICIYLQCINGSASRKFTIYAAIKTSKQTCTCRCCNIQMLGKTWMAFALQRKAHSKCSQICIIHIH